MKWPKDFPEGEFWVKLKPEFNDPVKAMFNNHTQLLGRILYAKSPKDRDIVGIFQDNKSKEPIYLCNKLYAAAHFDIVKRIK